MNEMMILTDKEYQFLELAQNSIFHLELLFEKETADKLMSHPRIKWIIQNKEVNDASTTN
ncbi:hypothetical protein [Haploplasma axanthum]|uniref:hypothetical protein n=1 Tax=Haploplasma axanthum TaxID=29552 RepID=UPI00047ED0D5|nr:hypothetical protein [Haploplasma axanthum]